MKWIEFKKRVEALGIKDDDEIWYIDMSFDYELSIQKDEIGIAISN